MKQLITISALIMIASCTSVTPTTSETTQQNTSKNITDNKKNQPTDLLIFYQENNAFVPTGDTSIDKKLRTLQGVMDKNGKIIIPADYFDLTFYQSQTKGKPRIKAIGKHPNSDETIIHIYNLKGNIMKNESFFPKRLGFVLKPEFTQVDVQKIVKKELAHIEDKWEKKSYFNKFIRPKYYNLYDPITDTASSIQDKNIYKIKRNSDHINRHYGIFPVKSRTNLYGFMNSNAEWVIEPQFEDVFITGYGRQLPPDKITAVRLTKDKRPAYSTCYTFIDVDFNTMGQFSHFKSFKKSAYDNKYYSMAKSCYGKVGSDDSGIIDQDGNWIIQPKKNISLLTHPNKDGYITFKNEKEDTLGVVDIKGNIVIPAKYYYPRAQGYVFGSIEETPELHQGLFAVSKEKDSAYYGFINSHSEWVIAPKLPTTGFNNYNFNQQGMAHTGLKDVAGLRVINQQGDDLYPHIQGSISFFNEQGFAAFKGLNGKMGVINLKGTIVVPPTYNKTAYTLHAYQQACIDIDTPSSDTKTKSANTEKPSLCGAIDARGKTLVKPIFKEVSTFTDYALVITTDGKYGIIDYHDRWLVPPQNERIKHLVSGDDIILDFGWL